MQTKSKSFLSGQASAGFLTSIVFLAFGLVTVRAQLTVQDGMVLWLKSDTGVTASASGAVSAWADQSPNANNAGPRTDGPPEELPLLVPNAANTKPVIRFDGVDDVLQIANSSTLQPGAGDWTVFFVGKRLGGSRGDFPQIIGSRPWVAGLDKGWSVSMNDSGVPASHYADGAAGHDVPAVLAATALSTSAFELWQVEENRGTRQTSFYRNGDADRISNTAMPPNAIDQADPIFIGREVGGANNRRANIDLAEIIIYNRALNETERNSVSKYLSDRYNLGFNPNVPPSINFAAPANNTSVAAPGPVTVTVNASDTDGAITSLELRSGSRLLASSTNGTLSTTVQVLTAGTATLMANATDNRGGTAATSLTITGTGGTTGTAPPAGAGSRLVLWLKADAGITKDSQGFVSAWADQSVNGNNAQQDNSFASGGENFQAQLVDNAVNGKPVVRFDGLDDFMSIPNSPSLQPANGTGDWTVIFAARRGSASRGDFPQIIGSRPWNSGTDKGWAVGFSGTGLVGSHYADGVKGHDLPGTLSISPLGSDDLQFWEIQENRASGYTGFYINGAADRILRPAMPADPIDQSNDIYIGSEVEGADNRRANVDLAEVLVYSRTLTQAERETVNQYLSGKYGLAGIGPVVGAPSIVTAPANISVLENQPVKLTVTADPGAGGASTLLYQWQKNGADIPGAYLAELTIPQAQLSDTGARYRVIVSNAGGSATSAEAVVTVSSDKEPPKIVAARRHFLNLSQVLVTFSEPVAAATGLDSNNYKIDNGIAVSKAEAGNDPKVVVLTTSEIAEGKTYTLTVNNVQDLFGNVIASNTQHLIALLKIVPHYTDTFTTNSVRTDGLYNNNADGAYNVEDTHGNPAATWLPTANFSFNTPDSSTDPAGLNGAQNNPGADTGFAQTGGGDFSFNYGLSSNYVVQADAILRTDRIDFTSLPNAGGGIFGANRLSVFFRRDSHPQYPPIGL
jgi:hypothetical protein